MRSIFRIAMTLLFTVSVAGAVATGQNKTTASSNQASSKEGSRARALFVNKRADAVQVVVLKNEGSSLVPVDASQPFKQGDQIKVSFQSNFEGYVYVINIAPSGKKCVLFPNAEQGNNAVSPDKDYYLPPGRDIIEFDNEKGVEVLQVVMSRERIPYLEAARKNENGCLAESAGSAAAELEQGGIVVKDVVSVVPQSGPEGVRSRNIIVAAGRDKDPQGSVVAIPDEGGKEARLKKGEAATFEIRLKHN